MGAYRDRLVRPFTQLRTVFDYRFAFCRPPPGAAPGPAAGASGTESCGWLRAAARPAACASAGRRAHTARPRARQPRDARRRAGWGPPGRVARASRERAAADVERSACEPASADKMHAHASVSRPRRVPTDPRARFNIKSVHTGNALNRTQSRPTAMSICTHAQTPHKDHKTQLSRHIPARPAPLVMLLSCGERTSRFGDGHHWTSRRT